MDRMTVSDIISAKIDPKITPTPEAIELAIYEIEQVIRNYCLIPTVPEALKFTVANMAIDLLVYQNEVTKDTSIQDLNELDLSDVASVKVGDTTIDISEKMSGNARKRILNSHTNYLDSIVLNYKQQLNRFRRLW